MVHPAETWQAIVGDARPVLLLDFDGTVSVGDEPILAYADALLTVLRSDGASDLDRFAETLSGELAGYLAGTADRPDFPDGYAAVAILARGVADRAQLSRAYRLSRAALASGRITVTAPPGLAELLDELADRVWRVLVTNAPADGVGSTLTTIGLTDRIDVVLTDAGKPDGWQQILPQLLADRRAESVLSIGDLWRNDVAEPLAAGTATALIDRFDQRPGPAHATGRDLPDLYPAIRSWATDPVAFARHRPAHHLTGGPS